MNAVSLLPGWLATVAIIAGTLGLAFATLTSKYQRKLNRDRERYIAHLEERNERLSRELRDLYREHDVLKGRVDMMTDLLTGKCPYFSIDESTGACRHCTRQLLYGQKPGGPDR